MKARFVIEGRLPSLNEYVRVCRGNKFAANQHKAEVEEFIGWYVRKELNPRLVFTKPVHVTFTWYEPDYRRDSDNVAFAKKYILDALQTLGHLKGDGRRHVVGFLDVFPPPDKDFPRIEVVIEEVE